MEQGFFLKSCLHIVAMTANEGRKLYGEIMSRYYYGNMLYYLTSYGCIVHLSICQYVNEDDSQSFAK